MQVKIKKLRSDAVIPVMGSVAAAAYDLAIPTEADSFWIWPNTTVKIPLGFCTELFPGTCALIYARSGLAIKSGLRLANSVAVIDSDYRGEWIVALHNDSTEPYALYGGDRIAQVMIQPVYDMDFKVVDKLEESDRGEGGLGSTGVHTDRLTYLDLLAQDEMIHIEGA